MAMYSTVIPGLPGGPLVTNHPVKIKLIPEWRTLNRPGIKASTPRRSVQHGNGNPNSSAAGEATYVYNGAEGRQASYHSSTDDRETWVMVPADEVTWQAADGAGPGNMNGFSNELVEDASLWADPARRDRAIDNVANFMGGVAARLGIAKPERHWDFNYNNRPQDRHDCPNKLKYTTIGGRVAWDIYAEKWQQYKAAELARMAATEPTPLPVPTYASADPIAEIADLPAHVKLANGAQLFRVDGMTVRAVRDTPRLKWATKGGPKIGPDVPKGATFEVTYLIVNADGSLYWYSPWATRFVFEDVEPVVIAEAA